MALYDDNIGIFKQYVKEYGSALQIPEVYIDDESNKGFCSFMHSFYEWLYYQIHTFLTPNKNIPKYESVIKTYQKYNLNISGHLPVPYPAQILYYTKSKHFTPF